MHHRLGNPAKISVTAWQFQWDDKRCIMTTLIIIIITYITPFILSPKSDFTLKKKSEFSTE